MPGAPLQAVPTPEDKRPSLKSIYALNKYAQERMSLLIGEAYGIPTIALRCSTSMAPARRYPTLIRACSPSSPHAFRTETPSGVRGRRAAPRLRPRQRCRPGLPAGAEAPPELSGVFNIGSGESRTVGDVALRWRRHGRPELAPEITGRYRTATCGTATRTSTAPASSSTSSRAYRSKTA